MSVAEKTTGRNDLLPFAQNLGHKIGSGLHSEVRGLGTDWVVKRIWPVWRRGGWQEQLSEDHQLLSRFLSPYIPSTDLVRCTDLKHTRSGNPDNTLIVQRRVQGRPLRNWTWNQLSENATAREELFDFTSRVADMYAASGRTPDLHGSTPNIFKQYDFKYSDNILIEEQGKVWLVDTGLLSPLWSPNWIGGRLHMAIMARATSSFARRLRG